jgi:hypothetical protein
MIDIGPIRGETDFTRPRTIIEEQSKDPSPLKEAKIISASTTKQ